MINLKTDLFTLAEIELKRKRVKYTALDVIRTAVKIRKWLDTGNNEQKLKRHLKYITKGY